MSIDQAQRSKEIRNRVAIGDLASQREIDQIPPKLRKFLGLEFDWAEVSCYWDCILQNTIDATKTDWETEFNQDTTTSTVTMRVPFRTASMGGELFSPHATGSSTYAARFFKILVYADDEHTVPYAISFTGSGSDIQLKVNGEITALTDTSGEHNSNGNITLIKGENSISIATDTFTDDLMFWCRLFDGMNVRWIDPNKARNPYRQGYTTGTGGGGSGGFAGLEPTIPA